MSTDAVAVLGFVALFALMLLRVPVGMATGLVSVPSVVSNGCGTAEPVFRCDLIVFTDVLRSPPEGEMVRANPARQNSAKWRGK